MAMSGHGPLMFWQMMPTCDHDGIGRRISRILPRVRGSRAS